MLGEQQKLLMEQKMKGPGVTEIIGGIGWIFGLVGVWAYFMSRKHAGKT
jgi:nickel transport protein